MNRFKDTDFLHASARVRTLETHMLGRRELQKMIDCRSFDEAFKTLSDAGIAAGRDSADYEAGLTDSLAEAYNLAEQISPDPNLIRLFRYKYDGHNLKTMIKARKVSGDYNHILIPLGTVALKELQAEFSSGKFEKLDPRLALAAQEADEALAKTSDPQTVDITIDKAVLETMAAHAAQYDVPFLHTLVAAQIDIANIRTAIRMRRMGKDVFFLRRVLAEGGKIDKAKLQEAFTKGEDELLAAISATDYGPFLESALEGLRGGASLTQFERLCDNYVIELLRKARLVAFGVEPLVSYLFAKESEIQAARIVLASKAAGVSAQQITERLRDTLS